MVIKHIERELVDLHESTNLLISLVQAKIASDSYNKKNDVFGRKYAIEMPTLVRLLNGIEARLRTIQIIKAMYFESIEHDILCRNNTDSEVIINGEFSYSTILIKQSFSINDANAYAEQVEAQLHNFVLCVSNILENLVRLKELLFRKIIVHGKRNAPISAPLSMYLEYLKILINLGYRNADQLSNVFIPHQDFIDRFLILLTDMRNKITHSCPTFLVPISGEFTIDIGRMEASKHLFSPSDQRLVVDIFVDHIYTEVSTISQNVLGVMIDTMTEPTTQVPH
jgi:hypothetical protein